MKFNKDLFLQKLSSRKLWSLIAALVGSILITFNMDENSIAQITAIIGGFGAIAVYILGESLVDQARAKNPTDVIVLQKETPNE